MDSVDLLTQEPNNTHVREALIYALRYDSNPGVRLKALDGLGAIVKSDPRVRDAVTRSAGATIPIPGVRTEALHLLEPVRRTAACVRFWQKLAQSDQNQYIRVAGSHHAGPDAGI